MEEKQINKIFKASNKLLLWTIITAVIAIALVGIAVYMNSNMNEEARDLHELIYNYEDKEGEYAKINLAYLPFSFAVEDNTRRYYFAMDSEDYMYIVRITDKTYEELEKLEEEQGDNFSYELKGYVFDIPTELKNLAIESYNEVFEEEIFTSSNFEEYVGSVYLDETYTPQTENSTALIGIATFIAIFSIAFLISFIVVKVRVMKVDKTRIENAKEELRGNNVKVYSKQKMYLTDNYVISSYNGLYILEYREILWLYNLIRYVNGIAAGKTLMAFTLDKKKIQIGHSTNVNNQTIEEIIEEIKQKNPELKIGFTDENKKYFKEYKKGNV